MPTRTAVPTSGSYTVAFANGAVAPTNDLTPSERREHDQLPHESRRRDWLAGRYAAKRAIAARSGARLDHILLQSRAGAAPRCLVRDAERWIRPGLSLSIAHRDGVAIAAAADSGTLVGVDMERNEEIPPEHHRYFLAPSESSSVDFTLVWMLKEAAWKALGLGRAVPFRAVQLAFDPATAQLRGVWVENSWIAARARVLRVPGRHDLIATIVEIRRETQ